MTVTQPPATRSPSLERSPGYGLAPEVRRSLRQPAARLLLEAAFLHVKAGAITALFIIVAGVVAILLVPRRYTSTASFVVEAPSNGAISSAMAVISQLNPNLAGGDSPKFYVDLVQSRTVLENLLNLRPAQTCGKPGRPTVLEGLGVRGGNATERMAHGFDKLSSRVDAGYDLRTGVISLSVEAECPLLAQELTDSLIASVNAFNVDRRQTRAKLRREFAEQQASLAESRLHAAEDQLATFQANNRVIGSPQLKVENDRLERLITMRQDLAAQLEQEASSARLDEINSLPAITVIDSPDVPIHASYPKRRVLAVIIACLACLFGGALAIVLSLTKPLPQDASEALLDWQAKIRTRLRLRSQ